jgi:hypothetical protein
VQVEAFGKHSMLRELANLVLIMASARPPARPPARLLPCLPVCCPALPCPALDAAPAWAAAVRAAAGFPGCQPTIPLTCVVFARSWLQGNRDNIDGMASGSQKVLTQVLKLVDAHDLVRASSTRCMTGQEHMLLCPGCGARLPAFVKCEFFGSKQQAADAPSLLPCPLPPCSTGLWPTPSTTPRQTSATSTSLHL